MVIAIVVATVNERNNLRISRIPALTIRSISRPVEQEFKTPPLENERDGGGEVNLEGAPAEARANRKGRHQEMAVRMRRVSIKTKYRDVPLTWRPSADGRHLLPLAEGLPLEAGQLFDLFLRHYAKTISDLSCGFCPHTDCIVGVDANAGNRRSAHCRLADVRW